MNLTKSLMSGKVSSHGMKMHCCSCVSGTLFSFLGIALMFTGMSMVLNYRDFDLTTLPLGWQNSEGQRNLGIVMICLSFVFVMIGIIVSVHFFISPNMDQEELNDTENPKHQNFKSEPSPPIVTVHAPVDHFPDRQPIQSKKRHSKHKRSHSSKNVRGKSKHRRKPLATHEEIAEEPDVWNLREIRHDSGRFLQAPASRVDIVSNWDVNDGESVGQTESCSDFNDDMTDTERDDPMTHLPPLLIAPAKEPFSTCDSLDSLVTLDADSSEDIISKGVAHPHTAQDGFRHTILEKNFRLRKMEDTHARKMSEDKFQQGIADDTVGWKPAEENFRSRSFENILRQKSLDDLYGSRSFEDTFGYSYSEDSSKQQSFDDTHAHRISVKPNESYDILKNTSPRNTLKHKRTKSSEEVLQFDRELSVILK